MIILLILFIIFYIVCAIFSYNFIRISHNPGGIWENISPDVTDIIVTLVPIANLIPCLLWLSDSPLKEGRNKKRGWISKFFRIKRNDIHKIS